MAKMGSFYGTAANFTQQEVDTIKLWVFLRNTNKMDFFRECLENDLKRNPQFHGVLKKMLEAKKRGKK